MPHFIQMLGLVGVFGINFAYILISSGRMQPNSYLYPFINFCGSSFVMIALVPEWNLSAFLMELSWALISLLSLIAMFKTRQKP